MPFPGSAPGANRTPCRILSSADNCPPVLGLCDSPPVALEGLPAGPSLRLPQAFLCSSCFLYLDGAGCSRAEDLSTADQAEGEAGRTGAEMQPDPAAQPGRGGQRPAAGGSSEADSDHATDISCLLIFLTSQTYSVCPRQYPNVIRAAVPVSYEHRELEIITTTAAK
ncbi:uncharacterized protein J5M81_009669 isoform 1-T1 [Pluvialis apricaria]